MPFETSRFFPKISIAVLKICTVLRLVFRFYVIFKKKSSVILFQC